MKPWLPILLLMLSLLALAQVDPAPAGQFVRQYAAHYRVSPELVGALIDVESRWNPQAVSGSDSIGADNSSEEDGGAIAASTEGSSSPQSQPSVATARPSAGSRSSAQSRRGPSVHRYNLGTWSAYHAARIAARSVAGAAKNQD